VWYEGVLIEPDVAGVEPPNPDLTDEIQRTYAEASRILNRSPRGAAALLRLCVQLLCKQLHQPGKHLDTDIATLVKNGLSPAIQQALDVVRVIGNSAVHPGLIDISDDRDTAIRLFGLINIIAHRMLTHEREVRELYEQLPQSARDRIAERDQLPE
jgi:hypothetical protein